MTLMFLASCSVELHRNKIFVLLKMDLSHGSSTNVIRNCKMLKMVTGQNT